MKRRAALGLGVTIGIVGLAAIGARAQILGQGGDAYVFRKKYPARSEYKVTIKDDERTVEGEYFLHASPKKGDQGNTQLLQFVFRLGKEEPYCAEYAAGERGLDQIDDLIAADYAELDHFYALLSESRLPEGPVKADQTWALDEKLKDQPATRHVFKGLSNQDGHELAEVEVNFKSADGEIEIQGTTFLRVSDGTLEKATYHRRYPDVILGEKENDPVKIVESTEEITVVRQPDSPAK